MSNESWKTKKHLHDEHSNAIEVLILWKFWKLAHLVEDTLAHVISLYKQLVEAVDTICCKRNQEAKGIREQFLTPTLVMTLLLVAEVLVLVKWFCTFLQTRNLNYGLIIGQFECLFSLLERFVKLFLTMKV